MPDTMIIRPQLLREQLSLTLKMNMALIENLTREADTLGCKVTDLRTKEGFAVTPLLVTQAQCLSALVELQREREGR